MNAENTFQWNDALVTEFVQSITTEQNKEFLLAYTFDKIKEFKASHNPMPERIEVDVFPTSGTDCKNGMWVYTYAASNPISQDKFPSIKTAIENVLNPEPKGKNKPIENEFIIGVDPIRGNFEWKDDAQTQVVFKKQEKGEWIAMYRKDNPWSQEHFEADMKKAAEYFSKVSLLCEECGEISKHKETCSQFVKDTLSRDWEILEIKSFDGAIARKVLKHYDNQIGNKGSEYRFVWDGDKDAFGYYEDFILSGSNSIHSVRRLSDNTVWTVGEMVSTNDRRGEHKIDGFKVIDGQMCVWMKSFPTEYEFLSRIQKLPPKTLPSTPITREGMCNICGGTEVYIRGRYPNEDKRKVCPTCVTERLDEINNISSNGYGQKSQSI